MIINVAGISQGRTRLTSHIDPRALELELPLASLASPVRLAAQVVKMGADVYIDARIEADVELACSRCLKPFRWPLRARLQVLYVPAQGHHLRSSSDGSHNFYHNDTIDLSDDVSELIASELPRKPLCRPDCPGLCPRCGRPLDDGPCDCPRPESGYHPFRDLKLD